MCTSVPYNGVKEEFLNELMLMLVSIEVNVKANFLKDIQIPSKHTPSLKIITNFHFIENTEIPRRCLSLVSVRHE